MNDLKPCTCGGSPKVEKFCGWYHIECEECGEYPVEYMRGSNTARVWGWNTRKETVDAWNRMVK